MNTVQAPSSRQDFWAFLVGINEYKSNTLNTLRGCVNDVEAMRSFLIKQLDVNPDHIKLLRNHEATREEIIRGFEEFLIENPDIERGAQILFHYSGHGSQMKDTTGTEPDGQNETIVPHDSRTEGVFDICDKRLARLLERLATSKGKNITVILDSCHSGSGTRVAFDPSAALARRAPVDDREPPPGFNADLRTGGARSTRQVGPSGWAVNQESYVLLAGCRDREESFEYWAKSGDSGAWHGALTYFTLQNLGKITEASTYADLHRIVAAQVTAEYNRQTPQCEGDRTRQVFGGIRVERTPEILVKAVEGDTVVLDAGFILGLRPDTTLALYSSEPSTGDNLPESLAAAQVIEAGPTEARARVDGLPGIPSEAIAVGIHAVITTPTYSGAEQTVFLQPGADEASNQAIERLRQALLQAGPGGGPSPHLRLVETLDAPTDLRVIASGEVFHIYGVNNQELVKPEDINAGQRRDPRSTVRVLETIARFRTFERLSNDDPSSELNGKIKLGIRRRVQDGQNVRAEPLPAEWLGAGNEQMAYFDEQHPERTHITIDVTNGSDQEVYPHVFALSPDFSINRIYPRSDQDEQLKPKQTFSVGLRTGESWLRLFLPPGWDESHDSIRVVVTTEFADLGALEQGGLDVLPPSRGPNRAGQPSPSQLDRLMDTVMSGRRFGQPVDAQKGADWTVTALPITTLRLTNERDLVAGEQEVDLGNGVILEKPADFAGKAAVSTVSQAARSASTEPALKTPPGITSSPDIFEPVSLAASRGSGAPQMVLELTLDEAVRRSVTREKPLLLRLPAEAVQGASEVLPVVFDGEDYLLPGYSSGEANTIKLVSLPQTRVGPDGAPQTRGTVHTLRLFLFKKLGIRDSSLGLHRVQLREGQAADVAPEQFRAGERVAVLVHGFNGDSLWMVDKVAELLRAEGPAYDHFLTYDYESFGTGVKENGEQLARELESRCGFGPDDDITVDVYAHSMGGLVSRCMIELSGGDKFVDRLATAGVPSQGTPLANLGDGFIFLTTWLLNTVSSIPPLAAAGRVLEKVFEQGPGLRDLRVDAPVLKELNGRTNPSNVPYLVLAGDYEPKEAEKDQLKRLATKVLDTTFDGIFNEPNDVGVPVSSIRGVRRGTYPLLKVVVLPCSHIQYFDIPAGREAIKAWLGDA